MNCDETTIRGHLERVLASTGFTAAPMLAAFLRYVVEETLAGRSDRLKAYTIAVAALERPENFDPNDNPLVRVQARRLRNALTRYYETDGIDDALRIDLPLGSYIPRFIPREDAPPPTLDPEEDDTAPPSDIAETPPATVLSGSDRPAARTTRIALGTILGVALGLASATAGILGWTQWQRWREVSDRSALVERTVDPTIGLDAGRVLPLLVIEIDPGSPPTARLDAEAYRRRLETFVGRFDDMVVITRRSPDYPPPLGQPLYRYHVNFLKEGDRVTALYQLTRVGAERMVKSGAYRFNDDMRSPHRPAETLETPNDLAILRDLVEANGALPLDLLRIGDLGETLGCLAIGNLLVGDRNPSLQRATRTCLEKAVAENPGLSQAYALLGDMYLREHRGGSDVLPGDPLARAEVALRRAIALAPLSATPRQTLAEVLQLRGDLDGALALGASAVELNPEDIGILARQGALLARAGRSDEALRLLRRAEINLDVVPPWVNDHIFLALDQLGRPTEADRIVCDPRVARNPLHLAVAAIRAGRVGDETTRAVAVTALLEIDTRFRDDPVAAWLRLGMTKDVADRMARALDAAGVKTTAG